MGNSRILPEWLLMLLVCGLTLLAAPQAPASELASQSEVTIELESSRPQTEPPDKPPQATVRLVLAETSEQNAAEILGFLWDNGNITNLNSPFSIQTYVGRTDTKIHAVAQSGLNGGLFLLTSSSEPARVRLVWKGDSPTYPSFRYLNGTFGDGFFLGVHSNQREEVQLLTVSLTGQESGPVAAHDYEVVKCQSGSRVLATTMTRRMEKVACPSWINEEFIKNNEALVSGCYWAEYSPIVIDSDGVTIHSGTVLLCGCQGYHCGPLVGYHDLLDKLENVRAILLRDPPETAGSNGPS